MKRTDLVKIVLGLMAYMQIHAQSNGNKTIAPLGPNDFPELIHTHIPGAPKLGKPQLVMGDTIPVRALGSGWAAPAVYDWNKDGKKDLLLGEFNSGSEHKTTTMGHFVRIYLNKGTDQKPTFIDEFDYAKEVGHLKESTGTPLSVYQTCCLAFTPRFADLDNDGFTDLLTGQYSPGYITWFRGSEKGFLPGTKLKEAHDPIRDQIADGWEATKLPITDPKGFLYWAYSSAAFGDFDNDGDQDMVLGGKALRFCENIGTKSSPEFGERKLLKDVEGNNLETRISFLKVKGDESSRIDSYANMVPYVVDWDQDGVLDILMTNSFMAEKGGEAVTFFRGLKTPDNKDGKKHLLFDVGVPLFAAKNGGKSFPGSWLNVWVTDWNNDGVNDLLIGTSIATLEGHFNHALSWEWEMDTGISKRSPAYFTESFKGLIAGHIKSAEERQKASGLTSEEWKQKGQMTKEDLIKNYYGEGGYKNKTLAHQGYVYVMLGEKQGQ